MSAVATRRGPPVRWALATWVATAGLASSWGAVAQPLFPALPPAVSATVDHALEQVGDRPQLRLAAARTDALRTESVAVRPTWDLSATLRHADSRGLDGDLRASASLLVLDPWRSHRWAELRAQETSFALQTRLARRDAVLNAVTSWLAAWAARERRELSRLARSARAGPGRDAQHRDALADDHRELELEATIWTERLARMGVPSDAAWPDHRSWRAWALRPLPASCPVEAPEVRVAQAEVERLRRSVQADRQAAISPSLRVGASLFASRAWADAVPAHVGARVWLELAPPAAGGWRASLRSEFDGEEGSVALQVGDADPLPPDTDAIALAMARDDLARALREAEERARLARAHLQGLLGGLDPVPPARPPPGSSFLAVERALADVHDTVRAVDARLHLVIDCALTSSTREGAP